MSEKPLNHVFFSGQIHCKALLKVVGMTADNSARGQETHSEVFPDTPESFPHPLWLWNNFLAYPSSCPTVILVRAPAPKKKTWFGSLKKTLLYGQQCFFLMIYHILLILISQNFRGLRPRKYTRTNILLISAPQAKIFPKFTIIFFEFLWKLLSCHPPGTITRGLGHAAGERHEFQARKLQPTN